MNLVTIFYLIASICFIQALKGLSHPETAQRGNKFGIAGMTIAILTTIVLLIQFKHISSLSNNIGFKLIAIGIAIGSSIGAVLAKKVQMEKMPELIAAMHSLIGLAAVCIASVAITEPWVFNITAYGKDIPIGNRFELFIGTFIGALTFSGSIIAFGKLSGKYKSRLFQGEPIHFTGQHILNLLFMLIIMSCGIAFIITQNTIIFTIIAIIAFILGITIIIPIGGADMPVIVSMLNSYSGWAATGIGFSLNNSMLIIAGSLVGSSGAILSYIMCKAMNRSFLNVILGGYNNNRLPKNNLQTRNMKSGSAEDAAFLIKNAESIIIIPGYGLAVARAQHSLKELSEKLIDQGISIKYAIHPVAGRMPGHMNVLLAEAEISYDQVFEMENINSEFNQTDIALILGANDVVNPAAKNPKSTIFGMPILEAFKAQTVIVNKRSLGTGYAGLDNELFYMEKTMMVFGDAKKVIEEIIKLI